MGVLLKLNLNSCVKKESFVIIIIVIVVVVVIIIIIFIIIIIIIIIINEQKGVAFPCSDTCMFNCYTFNGPIGPRIQIF